MIKSSSPASLKRDWLRLSLCHGIGPLSARALLHHFGSFDKLWHSKPEHWARVKGIGPKTIAALQYSSYSQAEDLIAQCQQQHIHIIDLADAYYPKALSALDDSPLILYMRGKMPSLPQARLAVVGSRHPPREDLAITRRWISQLASQARIISGMANGIDSAAHRACIDAKGKTIAVLGQGLSNLSNNTEARCEAIVNAQGCVLSEYPPSTAAHASLFPRRNRLIAGLADATLIIQAARRSGSLITARFAAQYGKEVMAIPGSVLGETHQGCHDLIQQGANLVQSTAEVCRIMDWNQAVTQKPSYQAKSTEEQVILEILAKGICHIDDLAEQCHLTIPILSPVLLALQLANVVEALPGSRYLLTDQHAESSSS